MNKLYTQILLFLNCLTAFSSMALPPTATISGGTTLCQNATGSVITFTGSSGTAPYTFTYTINGGALTQIVTSSSSNTVTLPIVTSVAGTFTYALVSVHDATLPITEQIMTGQTAVININPQADASLNSTAVSDTFNGFPVFKVCSNQPTQIDFFNTSTTSSTNTSYTINWGDSSANYTSNSNWNTISHNYAVGLWTLTYSITAQNGCNVTKIYKVFVGNNPAVGLGNPGNTDVCISSPLTFPITGTENNPPGTIYTVTFNDGSNPIVFNHPPPNNVTHLFIISSCGITSTVGSNYQNSFYASIVASNPCDQSSATVVPIRISTPPIANFSLPQTIKCTNSQICMTNTSTAGDAASSTGCSTPKIIWTITPNTGFTLVSGNLGNDFGLTNTNAWTSGSSSICPTFSLPGNYTITMKIGNRCGIDQIIKTICIEPPLTPTFTLNTTNGCAPLAVTATNTTNTTNSCNPPTYLWQVTHTPLYCANTTVAIPNQTTANANFNFVESGSYLIKLTMMNSCGTFNSTQTVIVKKPPTASIAPLTSYCGTATINPVATVTNCAPSGATLTYAWSFPGGNPTTANTLNPGPISYPTAGNYTVSLIVTNECGASNTASQTLVINQSPVITNTNLSETICSGTATTPVNLTTNPSIATFTWTATATTGISGFIPSGNTSTIPAQTISTTSNSVGTVTYTIIPTIGTCTGASASYIITVNPAAQVNQPTALFVCNGNSITPNNFTTTNSTPGTTYSWTNSNGLIGLATSGNGNIPTFTAINTTSAPISATISVTPSFSGGNAVCNGVTKSFTITVNPTGQVNQPNNVTSCNGTAVLVNFSTINSGGTTSYNWTNNTTAIGLPSSGTGNLNFTATNTTNTTITATITVTPTYSNGTLNCVGSPQTFTISINPSAQVNQPTAISVCNGSTIPTTNFSTQNTSGTTTYSWTNSNPAIGLAVSGTGDIPSFTAVNNGNSILNATIIVTPSILIGGTTCSGATKQFAISVVPNANLVTTTNKVICNGSSSPAINFSSTTTGGTTSYTWTNDTPSIGLAASGNGNIPIFTAVNAGSSPITASISVTPSFTNGGLTCTGAPQTFTITVNPSAHVNSTANNEVCNGNSIAATVFSTSNLVGTTTYSWTNSNPAIGLAASGNGPIPGFTANNTTATAVTATITVTPTFTHLGVSCTGPNKTFTIKINPSPIATISGTVSVCLNAPNPQITFTGSSGNAPYTFTYNLNGGTSQSITTVSGNSISINAPTNIVGTFTYNLINVQDSNATSCVNTLAQSAVVTVNNAPTINTQPLATQSICVGGSITNPLSVTFLNGTGTASYQWYANTTSSTTGGTAVGTNSQTYLPPVFNTAGTFYYYVVISFSGNGCGNITSAVASVEVLPDPIVATQPLTSQTLCQNAVPNVLQVAATGGIGSFAYQWYSNTSNSTTGGTLLLGETNTTFSPPTTNNGTVYYYCVITQPNGIGCNVTSATSQINVNLAPAISTNPVAATVCLGDAVTPLAVNYINGVGTPNYQWYSNTSNTTTGGQMISGGTNATFNPPATVSGTFYYYCVITFPSLNGGCEIITSSVAVITINQVPVISSQNQTICSSATFTVTPVNASPDIVPTGTLYTWPAPILSPIGAITGASAQTVSQSTISQTLINTSAAPATATYTITPTSGNCVGATFSITITINPAMNPNAIVTNSTCFGVENGSIATNITGGIPFTTGAPYSIQWTGPNGYSATNPNISNLEPGIYNLSITDAGGCPISNSYTITEPLDIVVSTDSSNNSTCFGSNNGSISISVMGGTGAYTYSWTQNTIPFATSEDISNLSPATYVVTVSDANNCGPKTATFIITEPPLLAINLVNQINVDCYGFATGAININAVGGTPLEVTPGVFQYNYSWSGPNGYASTNQNLSNLPAGIYTLLVTDNSGCTANLSVTITQSSEIIITASTTPIVCYNDNNATITTTVTGGNAPYQIQWSNLAVGLNQNNLAPGNYTITITDALGCQKASTINIPSPPIFDVTPVVTNISCFGANNGSIVLNFVGGIAPVNLVWSDGSPAGTTRNNLGPGTYSVIITDSKPCTISRTFTILEPQPLVLSANLTNALDCNNANTGAINLLVSGGTPPFNYSWNNGVTAEDLTNIPAGNYQVTVTDARGCTKTAQYSITRPSPIVLTVNTNTMANCATQSVVQSFAADVSGGVPPFQFNWSSGTTSGTNNEFMTTTQNGLVTLTATDAIGCSTIYSLNVDIPELGTPSFAANSIGYTSYGLYSILDPIQFQSTISGDYSAVLWDFGDGTFSNELNPVHTYLIVNQYYLVKLTVTYPFGCVYTNQLTLNVEKGYILVVPTAFTPSNNDGINDTLRPVTKGLKNIHMDVYDTWGSLIYSETGDVLVGWNGKIKDIPSENGNYYVKVSGETFYGTIINENQTFVLIK